MSPTSSNSSGLEQTWEEAVRTNRTTSPHNLDAFSIYSKNLSETVFLKPEEELETAQKAFGGDQQAINLLIISNLPFAKKLATAYHYRNPHIPLNDLIQEANIGLIPAAQKYDPSYNVRFRTYAAKYHIRPSISSAIQKWNTHNKVKIPVSFQYTEEPDDFDTENPSSNLADTIAWQDILDKVSPDLFSGMTELHIRTLIEYHGLDGSPPRSTVEIAQTRGVSTSNISEILRKAHKELGRRLDGRYRINKSTLNSIGNADALSPETLSPALKDWHALRLVS